VVSLHPVRMVCFTFDICCFSVDSIIDNQVDMSTSTPSGSSGTSSKTRQSTRVRDTSRFDNAVAQEHLDEEGQPQPPKVSRRKRKRQPCDAAGYDSDAADSNFTDSSGSESSELESDSEIDVEIGNEEVCYSGCCFLNVI
jgi:hypothetical protein